MKQNMLFKFLMAHSGSVDYKVPLVSLEELKTPHQEVVTSSTPSLHQEHWKFLVVQHHPLPNIWLLLVVAAEVQHFREQVGVQVP